VTLATSFPGLKVKVCQKENMKKIVVVFVLLVMAFTVVGAQAKAKASIKGSADVVQSITDLENQWAKESKAGNADAIGALLSEDVVIVDSDGTTYGKSEVVERVRKAKWQTNELSDVKVTAHGDSAIATGTWTGKGTDSTGKAVDTKERWADTWSKTSDGKWLCVASASATMK